MTALRVMVAGAAAGIFGAHRRGLTAIGAEVVGVQDINRERVRLVAAELGCRDHATLPELLAEEPDLAVIVAPPPFHARAIWDAPGDEVLALIKERSLAHV